MSQFTSKWNNEHRPGISDKIKEVIRTDKEPIKPKLEYAVRQINTQITKLDQTSQKLKNRDANIFNNIVASLSKHDKSHATVYATELVEIRKMNKIVTQSKLALEQIALRLNTVSELGDVVITLTPAMGIIKNIQSGVMNILPEAEHEISEISSLLSGILVDAGQIGDNNINFANSNPESRQIMAEASTVAEERMNNQFPDLPSTTNPSSTTNSLSSKNKIENLFE